MAKTKRKNVRPAKPIGRIYEAYMFKDKDPAIDEFRTVMQEALGKRNFSWEDYNEVHEKGGPAGITIHHWFEGATISPRNATLEAAGRALGKCRVWVDAEKVVSMPRRKK